MLRTVVFALTLNPSPKKGEGQLCGSPNPKFGRRGWGMRVFSSHTERTTVFKMDAVYKRI
jgi:hypothetical protein